MADFKTDWVIGDTGHADVHNQIGGAMNGSKSLSLYSPVVGVNSAPARAANNTAFAAAILDAKRTDTTYNESGGVEIAQGDYYIDDEILIDHHWGLKLYSHGRGARIMWRGGNSAAVRVLNSRECVLSNLIISGEHTGIGVQLARTDGATVVAHHNTLEQVEIENFTDCVSIGGIDAVDANNDFHEFNHCYFRDYHRYAVDLSTLASQSYNNIFNNCIASANSGTGQAAIFTGIGGGSFAWQGGGVSGNTVADFLIGRHYLPHTIKGVTSEGSARFIESTADNYFNLLVESCRWAGNAMHADGKAIKVTGNGTAHLSIRNCRIGDSSSVPAVLIDFLPTNEDVTLGGFEFVNNWVSSDAVSVFSGRAPTSKSGNIQFHEVAETFTAL